MIGIPELIATFDKGALRFSTISGMTGHLERHHNWVELIVVAALVFFLFSILRVMPPKASKDDASTQAQPDTAGAANIGAAQPVRTPAGRLTLHPAVTPASARNAIDFDDEEARGLFALAAFVSLGAVAFGTWAATFWWDDPPHHFRPAYVLYGSLALLYIVVPSVLAFVFGKDMPFPTLFRTVANLEEYLKTRTWRWRAGPTAAWLVAYLIVAGLVILFLHLTLYPYPNITKIINPSG